MPPHPTSRSPVRPRLRRDGASAGTHVFGAIGLSLVMTLSAVGCSAGGDGATETTAEPDGFVRVADASLPSNVAVPAPLESSVLSIDGEVGPGNAGSAVAFDLPTLERLGLVSVTTYEPFEMKEMEFTGVRLADVLAAAGVPEAATSVHLTALDDYQVDLDVDDIRDGGVLLATREGGEPIAVERGGPLRVVFGKGVAAGENPDQWIWSVLTMSVT